MSEILTIYANVAAYELTVDGQSVATYSLASQLQSAPTAKLPARLLGLTNGRLKGNDGRFRTLGGTATRGVMTVRWQLTDLLLFKPQAQGRGLADVAPALIQYAGDYLEQVRTHRKPLPEGANATAAIVDASVTPGVYEWPVGGGVWYFGVECVIDIDEILS